MKGVYRLVVVLTLLLFSMGESAFADGGASLKVGIIVPLSGPLAEYGVAIKNGFELGLAENPEFASRIKTTYEDSKYDTKLAVGNFLKLDEIDKVDIVIIFGGPMSEALAPLADAKKLPTLLSTNDPKVVKGRQYSVRFSNPAKDYGGLLSEWLKKRGAKKVGVVKTENQYLNAMYNGLQETLPKDITLEVIDAYSYEDNDFRSSVVKLKRKGIDAVGIYMLNGQVSSLLRSMKQQNLSLPVFGTDFFETKSEIQQAAGAMEGSVFPNNAVSSTFSEAYMKRYVNDSQITWAGYGHDMMLLIREVLKRSKDSSSPQAEEIMKLLRTTPPFEGAMGPCVFKETAEGDTHFGFPVMLKTITNGEIHMLTE